ncbi:hypothetical protein MUBE_04445 [Mycobacterium uberis]|uniref:Uncharacterized protein n=1 Tax=Mycobacterium uberis TaxID=2162698 RepID=A0A3E1HIE6_9MYCO|nr:hypothetical protein MUBE_04445 [Mycobacterium uberis]
MVTAGHRTDYVPYLYLDILFELTERDWFVSADGAFGVAGVSLSVPLRRGQHRCGMARNLADTAK